MATPSILDDYTSAVNALIAEGRSLSANATVDKTQTLVDTQEKRSALAGALLLHRDGTYHTVPHSGDVDVQQTQQAAYHRPAQRLVAQQSLSRT
jgi:hypothetical protein